MSWGDWGQRLREYFTDWRTPPPTYWGMPTYGPPPSFLDYDPAMAAAPSVGYARSMATMAPPAGTAWTRVEGSYYPESAMPYGGGAPAPGGGRAGAASGSWGATGTMPGFGTITPGPTFSRPGYAWGSPSGSSYEGGWVPFSPYQGPIPGPSGAPTTSGSTSASGGGGTASYVYRSLAPVPRGADPAWWEAFMDQHEGKDPVEAYGGGRYDPSTGQRHGGWREPEDAGYRAALDKAWGEKHMARTGRPPTEDEWKYHAEHPDYDVGPWM